MIPGTCRVFLVFYIKRKFWNEVFYEEHFSGDCTAVGQKILMIKQNKKIDISARE